MIPPLSTFTPTGAPVSLMMIGLSTMYPMNPHTTDGIAASSSITIFSVSLTLPVANSET